MIEIDNDKSVLFLDDSLERTKAFKSYFPWAKTVETADECICALKQQQWNIVFLDHDLGGEVFASTKDKNTGSEVVRFIVKERPSVDVFIIHSYNIIAADCMFKDLIEIGYNVFKIPFNCSAFKGL